MNNCTFSSNRAGGGRGGAILTSSNVELNNSIIHGNTSSVSDNGIRIESGAFVARYSLIGDSGYSPTSSTNVIGGNPSFVNETGTGGTMPTTAGDYRIHSNSSCIDTGNNSLVPSGIVTNIGGFGRIRGEKVDRGAFEGAGTITFHVKSGGTGNGPSWANASGDLQAMINASSGGNYIFVAAGTYKPNRKANALGTIVPNHRDNAFVLKNDVKMYGGFAGNETSLSQRDLSNLTNKTILSGDFNDDDVVTGSGANLNISGNGENAYHVVISARLSANTVLDGFTIQGGNANGVVDDFITVNGESISKYNGGGLINKYMVSGQSSTPTIINCHFTQNHCISEGGGLYSIFSGNNIFNIINCIFSRNLAGPSGGGRGGAITNRYNSKIKIINTTIWGNRAMAGGALGNMQSSAVITIQNSIIYGNNSLIYNEGSVTYSSSLVQGLTSTDNGNINGNTNPLFVNASSGDFRLQLLSPVANRGNNSYVPAGVTTDIAGNTRIQDCAVDIGAYESDPLPAPIAEDQTFCAGNVLSDLIVEGENLKFYDVAEGGTPLAPDTEVVAGTYYVSQTINDCESPRTAIVVTYSIDAPVVSSPQTFSTTTTVSDLIATGSNLQWYNVEVGGIALNPSQTITAGIYYVSQTIDGCQSPRSSVEVITLYPVRYVKPVSSGSGDGSSWENASDDLQAMINASNTNMFGYGDTIFVASGTYKPNRRPDSLDIRTPNQRDNSFVLKNNIRIHGGFAGWETSLDQRVVDPSNPSILSGDFNDDDVVSGSGSSLSISGNDENAYHVVISAASDADNPISRFTVLEGFTIKGGNANDPYHWIRLNNTYIEGRLGGGFYNKGYYSSPKIVNCIFTENQSLYAGGAIHTEQSADDEYYGFTIINSIFYNNITNGSGGALALQGGAKLINCTAWGNIAFLRGGFISMYSPLVIIYNTIAYGNEANNDFYGDTSGIFKSGNHLYIRYSMIQGESYTDPYNIPETDPQFVNPQNGDFRLQPTSPMINRGDNGIISDYQSYTYGYRIDSDIAGNDRIQNCAVDMGAYESDPIPAPVAEDQTFCAGNVLSDLIAEGENLQWYDVAEGGLPLDESTELTTGTYYVSQTINGCESPRASVNITYQTEPPTAWNQTFCAGDTVSDLTAEGENLQWYDAAEGGISLSPETLLDAGTYYVSQAIDSCESNRIPVSTSYQTEAPTAPSPQSYPFGTTVLVSSLVATGENLQWYITETGGTPLDPDVEIVDGTYYVSQTIGECESGRIEVTVNYIRYVKPVASGSGDGSSWDNASDDLQEMINISEEGSFIFVAAGIYKPIRPANNLNTIAPGNRNNSFVLQDGVKVYGGFAGTEASLEERDLSNMENISILSGDFNDNDVVSGSGNSLIISGKNENAYRIVISIGNSTSTVLDGFTIKGGNAVGSGNITVNGVSINNNYGGGMYYWNSNSQTINCIFTQNSAEAGGGLFIGGSSLSLNIINCVFSKNMATSGGSGLYNIRRPRITNCTFWGNKSTGSNTSAVYSGNGTFYFQNSIVYGNNGGFGSNSSSVHLAYNLIQGQTSTSDGNIPGNIDPLFIDPENGDFRLQATSPVINKGNNSYVPSGITTDIAGNNRIQLGTVDMGAYESPRYGVIWTSSDNWLNGLEPDQEKDVFIEGDLSVGTDYGDFSAKSLTVEEGGKLTINDENAITVYDKITNDAGAESFIIKSGGNLIQTTDYELDDNEGKITVERNSQPIVRLDYAFWSSPVKGQEIQAFSPMTLPNRIYTYETNSSNESTNGAYEILSNVNDYFAQGKGYLFRAPNDWISENSETGIPYLGKFTGEPTNGNINIPTYPNGFTSVGNPYPSNVDPELFLNANAGNISNLFFWNNPQRIYSEETESWGYTGTRYVTYSNLGFSNPDYEGKSISVGQGFIVYTTGNSVNFDNSMRTATEESFFKIDDTERHRFWLKLSDKEEHELNQILIGYMTGASNGIDQQIEGEQFGYEGSAIYSLIDEQKYAIQGRQLPFETTDVVPLGFKAEQDGKYTISLTSFDGLFAEGNTNIYLNDKLLETIHNLLESDYTFESQEGEFKDRFEILYQKQDGTMGSDDWEENAIRIYQHNQNIIIESKTEKISSVELYDLQGRSLYRNKNVNTGYLQIPAKRFGPTILIVKAQTQSGKIKIKKMLNK